MNSTFEDDLRKLRQASAEAKTLLSNAADELRAALKEEPIIAETPLEIVAKVIALEFSQFPRF